MSRFQSLLDFVECMDEATKHAICSKCQKTFHHDEELALEAVPLASSKRADPYLVIWENEDPRNPLNMSPKRKWVIVFATGAMSFCVSFASSVFSTPCS
jgi:hypothetical protein